MSYIDVFPSQKDGMLKLAPCLRSNGPDPLDHFPQQEEEEKEEEHEEGAGEDRDKSLLLSGLRFTRRYFREQLGEELEPRVDVRLPERAVPRQGMLCMVGWKRVTVSSWPKKRKKTNE